MHSYRGKVYLTSQDINPQVMFEIQKPKPNLPGYNELKAIITQITLLTHCDLVKPYSDIDLGQHRLR